MMLKNVGIDNEYVISGILHDIIEDTDYTYNDIKNEFGIKIADNVLKVSEDNNIKEWKTRKEKFLNKMESESDINILLLECADKLHNLMSDYNTYQKIGNNINSSASLEENKWWYNSLLKIIKRKCNNDLVSRFEKAVNYYYN
jgi:(p)ppGpp synthase/HD superfamily hydrolase